MYELITNLVFINYECYFMFKFKSINEQIIRGLPNPFDSKTFGQIPFYSDLKNQKTVLPEFTFFKIIIINHQFILFWFGL